MSKLNPLILIVEDNLQNVQVLVNILKIDKYQIAVATSGDEALEKINQVVPNLVILDLRMPGMSGEEVLEILSQKYPQVPVIITTAHNDPELIVKCMKLGALDYIVKPVDPVRTTTAIRNALVLNSQQEEMQELKEHILSDKLYNPKAFSGIITKSKKLFTLFKYIESLSKTKQPVLITGDTGTGKELFAKAVHIASGRKGKFVPVNTAGLDDQLFSDTLFGHVKGAYTGALAQRNGLIEEASDGTIFLDEIGDISKPSQVKLLRLLQENEYMPAGSDKYKYSTARVVLATNRKLEEMIKDDSFRMDLYYRLKAHCVNIPPLKDRKEDISLLFDYFLKQAASELGLDKMDYPDEMIDVLESYDFPGNIRELRGIVFEAAINSDNRMLSLDSVLNTVPVEHTSIENEEVKNKLPSAVESYFSKCEDLPTLEDATIALINEALKRSNGNKSTAAKMLDMNRGTLRNRLEEQQQKK